MNSAWQARLVFNAPQRRWELFVYREDPDGAVVALLPAGYGQAAKVANLAPMEPFLVFHDLAPLRAISDGIRQELGAPKAEQDALAKLHATEGAKQFAQDTVTRLVDVLERGLMKGLDKANAE